jgi:hypothetical protein
VICCCPENVKGVDEDPTIVFGDVKAVMAETGSKPAFGTSFVVDALSVVENFALEVYFSL